MGHLVDHVLFNYSWLHAKASAGPIALVLDDFRQALDIMDGESDVAKQVPTITKTGIGCFK